MIDDSGLKKPVLAVSMQRSVITLLTCSVIGTTYAEIIVNGSGSESLTLSGQAIEIEQSMGEQSAGNLFHSFEAFSVENGQTVTFTGDEGINHVISRVTGPNSSLIEGTVRSQVGSANFWLFNPNGVVITETGQFDVPAGLFISTADSVVFDNGDRFELNSELNSDTLSIAEPAGFGFLGQSNTATLSLSNGLTLNSGSTLALVSDDVSLNNADVVIDNGEVILAGTSEGEVVLDALPSNANDSVSLTDSSVQLEGYSTLSVAIAADTLAINNSDIEVENNGAERAGSIALLGDTITLDASEVSIINDGVGQTAGLTVSGSDLTVSNNSDLLSLAFAGTGGDLTVDVDGRVTVSGSSSEIATFSSVDATGGDLSVDAQIVSVSDQGLIQANTNGAVSGDLDIEATQLVEVVNGGKISAELFASGRGGDIAIRAPLLAASNNGQVSNNSFASGEQGMITIAVDDLSLTDSSSINNRTTDAPGNNIIISAANTIRLSDNSLIATDSFGAGEGGDISVDAQNVVLTAGGIISSGARDLADGGEIALSVSDTLTIDGAGDSGLASGLRAVTGDPDLSEVFVDVATFGEGDGGLITVAADRVALTNGGEISSLSGERGLAGSIVLEANQMTVESGSGIRTNAPQSAGGDITVNVREYVGVIDSEIIAEAGGVSDSDAGGNIAMDPELLLLKSANVIANANQGNGGNITIVADQIIQSPDTQIQASSNQGVDGEIRIEGVTNEVSSIDNLNVDFLDVAGLLSQRCAVDKLADRSSFVVAAADNRSAEPFAFRLSSHADTHMSAPYVFGVQDGLSEHYLAAACP